MISYEQAGDTGRFELRARDEMAGIVGVIIANQHNSLVIIEKISVQLKRQGIGTKFITDLESWALKNDAKYIVSPLPICEAEEPKDILGSRYFFQHMGYHTPLGIFLSKKLQRCHQIQSP